MTSRQGTPKKRDVLVAAFRGYSTKSSGAAGSPAPWHEGWGRKSFGERVANAPKTARTLKSDSGRNTACLVR